MNSNTLTAISKHYGWDHRFGLRKSLMRRMNRGKEKWTKCFASWPQLNLFGAFKNQSARMNGIISNGKCGLIKIYVWSTKSDISSSDQSEITGHCI